MSDIQSALGQSGSFFQQTLDRDQNDAMLKVLDAMNPQGRLDANRGKLTLNEHIQAMPGNFEENKNRIYKSLFLSAQYGIDPVEALGNLDSLEMKYWGDTEPVSRGWQSYQDVWNSASTMSDLNKAYVEKERLTSYLEGLKGRAGYAEKDIQKANADRARAGTLTTGKSEKSNESLMAEDIAKQIAEVEQQIGANQKEIDNLERQYRSIPDRARDQGWANDNLLNLVELVSPTVKMTGDAIPEILGGMLLGGAIGGVRSLMGAAASGIVKGASIRTLLKVAGQSAARSALTGAQLGFTGSMTGDTYGQAGGQIYRDLTMAGVPHAYASNAMKVVGGLSAGIEFVADLFTAGMLNGVGTWITNQTLGSVMKKAAQQGIKDALKRGIVMGHGIRMAGSIVDGMVSEGIAEFAQSLVADIGYNITIDAFVEGSPLMDFATINGIEATKIRDIWDRAWASAAGGALMGGLFGGAFGVMGTLADYKRADPYRQKAMDFASADARLQEKAYATMAKGETPSAEGAKVVYHAGADASGKMSAYATPEEAAKNVGNTKHSVSSKELFETLETNHGSAAAKYARDVQANENADLPAGLDPVLAETIRTAALNVDKPGANFSPEVMSAFDSLGIELMSARIFPVAVKSQDIAYASTEAEADTLLQSHEVVVLKTAQGEKIYFRSAEGVDLLDAIPITSYTLPRKNGKITLEDSGASIKVLDPTTKTVAAEANYVVEQDGSFRFTSLPTNSVMAHEMVQEIRSRYPDAVIDVDADTRMEVSAQDETIRKLAEELGTANQARNELLSRVEQGGDLEALGESAEALTNKITALLDAIRVREAELYGDPLVTTMDGEAAMEEKTERTSEANQDARVSIYESIREHAPHLTPDEVSAAMGIMEIWANNQGITLEEWHRIENITYGKKADPRGKGYTKFLDDGRKIIHLGEKSDISTVVHEWAHVMRRSLSSADQMKLLELYGVKSWKDTVKPPDSALKHLYSREGRVSAEELFAHDFEAYLTGNARPLEEAHRSLFDKIVIAMKRIYSKLRHTLTDGMQAFFDGQFGFEQKTAVQEEIIQSVQEANPNIPVDELYKYAELAAKAVPIANIEHLPEIPQFKADANEEGVVTEIGPAWNPLMASPIYVWERKDGRIGIVTGRHRLALAKKNGLSDIPAVVLREEDGYTAQKCCAIDAEMNILDGQGTVEDYVRYFRQESDMAESEARARGLLSRSGETAWWIARSASDATLTSLAHGTISPGTAAAISRGAPGNEDAQRAAIRFVQDGRVKLSSDSRRNTLAYSILESYTRNMAQVVVEASQLDLFGGGDDLILAQEKIAAYAATQAQEWSAKYNQWDAEVRLHSTKRQSVLEESGTIPGDKLLAIQKRDEALDMRDKWVDFYSHPELMNEAKYALGMATRPEVEVETKVEQEETLFQPDDPATMLPGEYQAIVDELVAVNRDLEAAANDEELMDFIDELAEKATALSSLKALYLESVKKSLKDGQPVPSHVLLEMKAEPWASEELVHRSKVEEQNPPLDSEEAPPVMMGEMLGDEEMKAGESSLPKTRKQAIEQFTNRVDETLLESMRDQVQEWIGSDHPQWLRVQNEWLGPKVWAYLLATKGKEGVFLDAALQDMKRRANDYRWAVARFEGDIDLLQTYQEIERNEPPRIEEQKYVKPSPEQRITQLRSLVDAGTYNKSIDELTAEYKTLSKELRQVAVEVSNLRAKMVLNENKAGDTEGALRASIQSAKEEARKLMGDYQERQIALAKRKVELRNALEYKNFLMRKIMAPVPKSVDHATANLIRTYQEAYDPTITKAAAQKKIQNAIRAADNLVKLNKEVIDRIEARMNRTSLAKYDIADLEADYENIKALIRDGREVLRMQKEVIAARRKHFIDTATTNIMGGRQRLENETNVRPENRKLAEIFLDTLNPQAVLDRIDGKMDTKGPVYQFFYRNPTDQVEKAAEYNVKNAKANAEAMKANKISEAKLGSRFYSWEDARQRKGKVKAYKEHMTVNEAIGVYIYSKNEKGRMALDNMLPQHVIEYVIDNLPDNYKAYGDFMIGQFATIKPMVSEALLRAENRDLPTEEENYFPMMRRPVTGMKLDADILEDLKMRSALGKQKKPRDGFTKARQIIKKEHQNPIRLDAVNIYIKQYEEQVHYALFREPLMDMSAVAEDKLFQDVMIKFRGEEYIRWLKQYISHLSSPDLYTSVSLVDKMITSVRHNTVIGALAANVPAALTNLVSPFYYLRRVGLVRLLASLGKVTTIAGGIPAYQRMITLSPQMAERFDPLLKITQDLKAHKPSAAGRMGKVATEALMTPFRLLDMWTITAGWDAVFQTREKQYIKQGLTPEAAAKEAAKDATQVTLETQPPTKGRDLSRLMADKGLISLLTMFATPLQQTWTMTANLPNWKKVKQIWRWTMGMGSILAGGVFIAALRPVLQALMTGEELDDEEWEGIAMRGTISSVVSQVPIVGGPIWNGLRYQFGDTYFGERPDLISELISGGVEAIPATISILDELYSNGGYDNLLEDTDNKNAIKGIIKTFGMLRGIPQVAINRVIESVSDNGDMDHVAEYLIGGGK